MDVSAKRLTYAVANFNGPLCFFFRNVTTYGAAVEDAINNTPDPTPISIQDKIPDQLR